MDPHLRASPVAKIDNPDLSSATGYLRWLLARSRRTVLLAALYGVVCTLGQALVPAAIGRGIDAGMIGQNQRALLLWSGAVLALGIVQACAGTLRDRAAIVNRFSATFTTMRLVTRQATRLGATLSRQTAAGEVVNVGATDIERIGLALEATARGSGAVVSIAVVAGLMLAMSWQLGIVVLAGVPVMVWVLARLVRVLHARQEAQRNQQAELTGLAVDIVGGLRVLRGIGGEGVFAARYHDESQRLRRSSVRAATVEATALALRIVLPGVLITAVVWLGARYVLRGELAPGQMIAFYGYAVFLAGQLRRVTDLIDRLIRAHVAAGHAIRLLRLRPEWEGGNRVPTAAAPLADPSSGLVVAPGLLTAVVCASHADAQPVADRLGHFAKSAATLDCVPIAEVPRPWLREAVLVTTNDDRLFSGALRDQLDPHGRAAGDSALIHRALANAGALDVVEGLPDGLDADVVGAGREFSGGQQQRLRLARALLADPEVLVLVEPTNAVDAHTEQRIGERLAAARAGKATVVFTTSPGLIAHADRVALVVRGRVVAEGTHQDLQADERYRCVVSREVGAA